MFKPELVKWLNGVLRPAPAHTQKRYSSAFSANSSLKSWDSAKSVRYFSGSEASAACFVPILLRASSLMSTCTFTRTLHKLGPSLAAKMCSGRCLLCLPEPNSTHSSSRPPSRQSVIKRRSLTTVSVSLPGAAYIIGLPPMYNEAPTYHLPLLHGPSAHK